MRSRTRVCVGLGVTLACFAASATPAAADHHLIKIREFGPGLAATPNDAFLELQMYAAGQNVLGNQEVHVYPANTGSPGVHVFNPGLPIPPNDESQRTVLAAGTGSALAYDYPENFTVNPLGGAICFVSVSGFGVIDCVEWGTGTTAVDAGTPVAPGGIPDGSSITRSIASGCPTLLENGDDTNDSATDFAVTTPTPRPNSVDPIETSCGGGGGGGGGGGSADNNPPETEITKKPAKRTTKKRVRFEFRSSESGSKFECRLDGKPFASCTSPFRKKVKLGKHTFQVRATDAAGNVDGTPAKARFKRVRP